MKPFTMFKLLTLASLLLYTLGSTAADAPKPAGAAAPSTITLESSKDSQATKNQQCVDTLNFQLSASGNVTQVKLPISDMAPADIKKLRSKNPAEFGEFVSCMRGTSHNASGSDAKCERAREAISKEVEQVVKDCTGAPKVSTEKLADDAGVIDTADPTRAPKSKWGLCLQNATSCKEGTYGENESADKCSEQTLEDLARNGANEEKLKTFCQDRYPPQCGAMNKVDLRTTAKDLDKELTTDLVDLQKDIVLKKRDIQENQDKLMEIDKAQQALPSKFDKQTKDLQKQYEAMMKASNQALDAGLENYYKMIATDEQGIKTSAASVTMADAARFDAQNKFVNACKAKAKALADQEFPSGGVNYGGQNALITRNARWSDFYNKKLQEMYADGTTCDNGNYANAQLAMLNAQKAQTDSEAQLAQDQNQLRIAIQQVASKKNDANYKGLIDQADRVRQLAEQQKQEYTSAIADRQKAQKRSVELQQELMKLEAKVAAGPKKRQCIQTLRSCASIPGIPNGSSKDVPNLESSLGDIDNVIKACRRAGKDCNSAQLDDAALKEKSISEFNSQFEWLSGVDQAKILKEIGPFDYETVDCGNAIASKMEARGSIVDKKKAQRDTKTVK